MDIPDNHYPVDSLIGFSNPYQLDSAIQLLNKYGNIKQNHHYNDSAPDAMFIYHNMAII